jgi:RimJ/RimL family protein N-acetyltransferase/8-oxo-dGTP pyrophosphatase MutT (NUDIX family)
VRHHVAVHVFLSTDRLVLRRLTEADLDNLAELDSDPLVMRYLTNGVSTPRELIRDEILPGLLREYERTGGLGRWAAVSRADGEFVGWFALRVPASQPDEVELGYRLRRSAWGKGYGAEGACALVRTAFAKYGMRRVYAQTMAVNVASRRVMEKAGLRLVRTFYPSFEDPIPGTEHGEVEYEVTRFADALARYQPGAGEEVADVRRVRELLAADDPWDRGTPLHVTGSALVLHPPTGRVLLRWHAKQQAWLQVGGHADPGERDPLAVALREGREETGLDDLVPWPDAAIRHVVIVPVAAGRHEGAHQHADVRYTLATYHPDSARPERPSAPLRWLSVPDALAEVTEANLRETLYRAQRLLAG